MKASKNPDNRLLSFSALSFIAQYLCDSNHRMVGDFLPLSSLLTIARELRMPSSALSISSFCSQLFSAPPHPKPIIPMDYGTLIGPDWPSFEAVSNNQQQGVMMPRDICVSVAAVKQSGIQKGVDLSYHVLDAFIVLNDREINLLD